MSRNKLRILWICQRLVGNVGSLLALSVVVGLELDILMYKLLGRGGEKPTLGGLASPLESPIMRCMSNMLSSILAFGHHGSKQWRVLATFGVDVKSPLISTGFPQVDGTVDVRRQSWRFIRRRGLATRPADATRPHDTACARIALRSVVKDRLSGSPVGIGAASFRFAFA